VTLINVAGIKIAKLKMKYPKKIISGGQTGVDRAGLDAAKAGYRPCGMCKP
jgi:hypothetical protein